MNGYNLLRDWYNYKFSHPSKVKAIHSDMYCYLIDLWNRLGQKDEFGLPTQVTMEALGIGSYNTYKKTFEDLVEFGFVKLIADSKNQHQSRVVALSKNDKASDEAPDKALDKAHIKATDTIIKQETKKQETKDLVPFQERVNSFLNWFNLEFTKHDKPQAKFRTLNNQTESNLKKLLDKYTTQEWSYAFSNMIKSEWVIESKNATPDHFLRPANFEKYVNQPKPQEEKFNLPHLR